MRKTLRTLLVTLLLLCALTALCSAEAPVARDYTGRCGPEVEWILDGNLTLTITGTGEMFDNLTDYVSSDWNKYASQARMVKVGGNVTSIGIKAFEGFSDLTSVYLADSVTQIGQGAFHFCTALKEINLPQGVQVIPYDAFNGCKSLTKVQIPDGVLTIEDYAFQECEALTAVQLPTSVTKLGNRAFSLCSSLRSITGLDSVTKIGESAFAGCASLSSIQLPTGLNTIEYGVFEDCPLSKLYLLRQGDLTIADYNFNVTGTPMNVYCASGKAAFEANTTVSKDGNDAYFGAKFTYNYGGGGDPTPTPDVDVHKPAKIKTQPKAVTVERGQMATFTITATNATAYQWQASANGKQWTDLSIEGAQTSTISFTADSQSAAMRYRCAVTGGNGKVTNSKAVKIKLTYPPAAITMQPLNVVGAQGDTVSFTVEATDAKKYQWQYSTNGKKWKKQKDAKDPTLTLVCTAKNMPYQYRCVITGLNGKTVISDIVRVIEIP